ncbi:MAG TPA: MFS transporter [Steroidobacteraceae bacterium]|nr:MFS transporter [Steroidobacteraceae bacterium]
MHADQVALSTALHDPAWTAAQRRLLALAALAFCADGLANQALSLALPALIKVWSVPREAFAAVTAAGFVGVAIGAISGGLLGDTVGRKRGLIGSILLFGVTTAAAAWAEGLNSLMLLRLLSGLGIGGAIPNGAALVFECTPARHRNLAMGIAMTFIPIGGMVAGLLGGILLPRTGWSGLFLACGLLPILLALALVMMLQESPLFLARAAGASSAGAPAAGASSPRRRFPIRALFAPGLAADTAALWVAFFFCLLASYALLAWVPAMLIGQGFALAASSWGMMGLNFGSMTGSVLSGWAIGRVGSRIPGTLVALGALLGAVVLGTVSFGPQRAAFTMGALFFEGFCLGGLHNTLYSVSAHMYGLQMRATGVGGASGAGRLGAVLSAFTGALSLKLGGASGYFIVIAAAAGLSLAGLTFIRRQIRTDEPQGIIAGL